MAARPPGSGPRTDFRIAITPARTGGCDTDVMNEPIAVVTDHRTLKVYILERDTPALRLAEEGSVSDWTGRFSDEVSDSAGGFRPAGAPGPSPSPAERYGMLEEQERRSVRRIAATIGDILQRRDPDEWSFIAGPDLHRAVLDQLPPAARKGLARTVARNLIHAPSANILVHLQD